MNIKEKHAQKEWHYISQQIFQRIRKFCSQGHWRFELVMLLVNVLVEEWGVE